MYVCFVVPPRNLMIDIQKDTAVEGEEIEVNCTAMASKPATTIRWFKGNKELKGKPQIALFGSDQSALDSSKYAFMGTKDKCRTCPCNYNTLLEMD